MTPCNVKIGNAQNLEAATGCTVVLCERGAVAGVDVRGGGPATRETDLLKPENTAQDIHAVVLSGGSAYGLSAAGGVMRWLEERGVGFDVGVARVPLVCGASLFDLQIGRCDVRPDEAMGYAACEDAMPIGERPVAQGNVGAGAGATVGKLLGPQLSMKSGLGYAAVERGNLYVGALVAVNAAGNVLDRSGATLAGVRNPDADAVGVLEADEAFDRMLDAADAARTAGEAINPFSGNTTIGCVITNAALTKSQATKVSAMMHDAYARAVKPVHTTNDGDTIFTLATGELEERPGVAAVASDGNSALVDAVAVLGARAMEQAVRNAVLHADSLCGVPALRDAR